MFKKDLQYSVIDVHRCDHGRKLLINVQFNGNIYSIMNVYCPNDVKQRMEFINGISDWIERYAMNKSNLVIGGDFNCVNYHCDRTKRNLDKSSEVLTELKSKHNLIDIWRQMHPDEKAYTFIDPSARDSNSRIDFFYVVRSLVLVLPVQISHVLPNQIIKLLIFIYSYIEIGVEKVTGHGK